MHIVTHGLISWLVAESLPLDRRGRACVTLAGVLPDLDGLGAPVEVLSGGALPWFSTWHHVLCHNLTFVLAVAVLTILWTRKPWIGVAALVTGHLHLLADIAGGRGPDGHQWPIPYLAPFSMEGWIWSGQWALNAWPNIVTTLVCVAITAWLARRRGRSPVEIISLRLDARVVGLVGGRPPCPDSKTVSDPIAPT